MTDFNFPGIIIFWVYGPLPPLKVRLQRKFILWTRGPEPKASWERHTGACVVWVRDGGQTSGPCGLPGPVAGLLYSLCQGVKCLRKLQEWTLKASSCSECMLLSERRSGSLSSNLVKMADSLGWFLVMRLRRARISVSCRASTEFTFSMPERSERGEKWLL